MTHNSWSLYDCLSKETLEKLVCYQMLNYGAEIEIPPIAQENHDQFRMESSEDIDKLMKQPPSRSHE